MSINSVSRTVIFPSYPDFDFLHLRYKNHIQNITDAFPPYSDYNFASLWSYNTENDMLLSDFKGNIIIRFRDYVTNEPFYSFIGSTHIKETLVLLLTRSQEEKMTLALKLIPESNLTNNDSLSASYTITEDRDNFDYIYSIEQLITLQGPHFAKKRNKLNKFLRNHSDAQVIVMNLTDPQAEKHIFAMFELWRLHSLRTHEEVTHELIALKRLLADANNFNLVCVGVMYKDQLIAVTITELLPKLYANFHFSKADPHVAGIYEFLYVATARELAQHGCTLINREQDLGIPNLRHAKSSWNPTHFLKKYTITPK